MYNFIAIEGCIGAGKSTLTKLLSAHYNCASLYENFEENPYLQSFYEEPDKKAFSLELFFMAERYKQQTSSLDSVNLFNSKLISDYAFFKSKVFANITLKNEDMQLFKMLYHIIYPQLKSPDLVIYLHKPLEKLQENISKRGRKYEFTIQKSYLEKLNQSYLNYFKQQSDSKIVVLDASKSDFLNNKNDFQSIIDIINSKHSKKISFL